MHRLLICLLFALTLACTSKKNPEPAIDFSYPPEMPEVFLPGLVSVEGRFDMGITLSKDGQTLFFGVAPDSDTQQPQILQSYGQADGSWSQPERAAFPGNANTFFPQFGPRDQYLYYAKAEAGRDTELWRYQLNSGQKTQPERMNQGINSEYREAGHGMTLDSTFYFTSNRIQTEACCGDVFSNDNWNKDSITPSAISELSSVYDEESIYVSPNHDYMIIQAWKPEYEGKHDLYISYRDINGQWQQPERLINIINSPEIEQRPFITRDNKALFFSRTSVEQNGDQVSYDSDIYWISTEAVFEPYVYNPEPVHYVKPGEEVKLEFASDLFRHVTDTELSYDVSLKKGKPLPASLDFNTSTLTLSGLWPEKGPEEILIFAMDQVGHKTSHTIQIERQQ